MSGEILYKLYRNAMRAHGIPCPTWELIGVFRQDIWEAVAFEINNALDVC
jgi:hypothetical protein